MGNIDWIPAAEIPAHLKDGREVLLWDGVTAVVATWSARGAHFGTGEPGWSETQEGSGVGGVTYVAEITPPQ
jgi:hypothetical protein